MTIQADSMLLWQEDVQTPVSKIESLGYMPKSGISGVMAKETPFCTRHPL